MVLSTLPLIRILLLDAKYIITNYVRKWPRSYGLRCCTFGLVQNMSTFLFTRDFHPHDPCQSIDQFNNSLLDSFNSSIACNLHLKNNISINLDKA